SGVSVGSGGSCISWGSIGSSLTVGSGFSGSSRFAHRARRSRDGLAGLAGRTSGVSGKSGSAVVSVGSGLSGRSIGTGRTGQAAAGARGRLGSRLFGGVVGRVGGGGGLVSGQLKEGSLGAVLGGGWLGGCLDGGGGIGGLGVGSIGGGLGGGRVRVQLVGSGEGVGANLLDGLVGHGRLGSVGGSGLVADASGHSRSSVRLGMRGEEASIGNVHPHLLHRGLALAQLGVHADGDVVHVVVDEREGDADGEDGKDGEGESSHSHHSVGTDLESTVDLHR
ncbi:hypothetical protein PMAYCL1PPCAC_15710, partial [Pristionchus mayeri]